MMQKYAVKQGDNILETWATAAPAGSIPWPTLPEGQTVLDIVNGAAVTGPVPTTDADVNAERDRRLLTGSTFTVGGMSIRIEGTQTVRDDLESLHAMARANLPISYQWRDADNTIHALSRDQFIELYNAATAHGMAIKQAAWAIKDDPTGLPTNVASDSRWPS